MKQITLAFDISPKHLGYDEAADLRREISEQLDKALKDAGIGKWKGGTCKFDSMEIFLAVADPDKAVEIIQYALADHWTFPMMKISSPTP